jgi:hypothetical protein
VGQQSLYVLDFFVRYWESHAANADKTKDAGGAKYRMAFLRTSVQADEGVAGEKRNLDCFVPIAPAMPFCD